ncbi:MAG TPA: hypothetical protein H9857_09375, partial [Candidatus Desulfovibrio intestinigallinarum]|nr:hypothetical protein [Candidatus Desulfovibrio intestinigallinarum]
ISNHTACRFAEKAQFFRLLWAGRRCAAASRFTFFKVETLWLCRMQIEQVLGDMFEGEETFCPR